MLPDPQEVASRIAEKLRKRKEITRKHRNIHIALAVILWILAGTFLILLTSDLLHEVENVTHMLVFSVCFILSTLLVIFPTLMAIVLYFDGDVCTGINEWYFQRFLNCSCKPTEDIVNLATIDIRFRRSSDAQSSSTVTVDDIRLQENPEEISINDSRGQFAEDANPLEPEVPNVKEEEEENNSIQVSADINFQNIDCAQPSGSPEDSSSTLSPHLTSTASSDRTLTGPSVVARQISTFSEVSELSEDSRDLSLFASRKSPELVQEQASGVECQKSEQVVSTQVPDVESKETDHGNLRKRHDSSEKE